jgi:long-subunit fatty acid transport protein
MKKCSLIIIGFVFMVLAHLAGAEVSKTTTAAPKRDFNGNLLFHARSWVLAESSASTPATANALVLAAALS